MLTARASMLKPLPVSKPLDRELARALRDLGNAEAKASEAKRRVAALQRAQSELISALVEEHRSLDLHTDGESASIKHMQTAAPDAPKKIGRPITSDHPFVAKALRLHGSIKAAAKALGVHPSTARSWYAEGDDARPIPATMAARLSKAPWSISQSAWRRVG